METVLFEDHCWHNFRPVAAAHPLTELRCGMFNARERSSLAGLSGRSLMRPWLQGLQNAAAWPAEAPDDGIADGVSLWLSGRVPPSVALIAGLAELAEGGARFVWRDEQGVLAAALDPAEAGEALQAWRRWADGAADGDPFDGLAAGAGFHAEPDVAARLGVLVAAAPPALGWTWDVVDRTAAALELDAELAGRGTTPGREPFGLVAESADPFWAAETAWTAPAGGAAFWCGQDVSLHPTAAVDATGGPVLVDAGCVVGPHATLVGPLYLGPGSRVKAGAHLDGQCSFGIGNRVSGEIGESTFGDFANKQHDGFIGHAVLGAWINLGALTTCSDLKNNYGEIRVDLGGGEVATGRRFVGLMAGDHVKTAIGTLFNTGTVVGFASNVFGGGMPPKHVPAFSWGGGAGAPVYDVERALETARIVMARRGCVLSADHEALFRRLASG